MDKREVSRWIATAIALKLEGVLHKNGLCVEELNQGELNRLIALITEEGKNIMGKAELAAHRLSKGSPPEAAAIMALNLTDEAVAEAARRFLAHRGEKNGPAE